MKLNKIIRGAVLHPPGDLVQPFGDTSFFVTLMHLYHMYVENFNRFCLLKTSLGLVISLAAQTVSRTGSWCVLRSIYECFTQIILAETKFDKLTN